MNKTNLEIAITKLTEQVNLLSNQIDDLYELVEIFSKNEHNKKKRLKSLKARAYGGKQIK